MDGLNYGAMHPLRSDVNVALKLTCAVRLSL